MSNTIPEYVDYPTACTHQTEQSVTNLRPLLYLEYPLPNTYVMIVKVTLQSVQSSLNTKS